MKFKNNIFNLVKIIILLLSIGFIINKLINFEYWYELKKSFDNFSLQRILLLLLVVLLMPFNWSIEVKKWQKITKKTFDLDFFTAFKSVLSGLYTGYITPNRVGEFAGRVLYLPHSKRTIGVVLSLFNGLTQNIVILLLGGGTSLFYFTKYNYNINYLLLFLYITLIILISVILVLLYPIFIENIRQKKWAQKKKIKQLIEVVSIFQMKDLLIILFWSAIRFVIFNVQFFLLLQFFGVSLTSYSALISIPTMYFFITFTPSFAFSEPVIRGAYSVFILGVFSTNQIGIILTGIMIWIINLVLPLLIGVFFTTTKKSLS